MKMEKEDVINAIEHMVDNGCSPIMRCRECPLDGRSDQSKVLLCAALSAIREGQ